MFVPSSLFAGLSRTRRLHGRRAEGGDHIAPPPGRSGPRPSSVLPSHQEAAAAQDQDHRRDQHHRRERVDGWRDAKPDHRVYLQRQRARPYARDEERYDEVVEREGERQESSGHDPRQDERECYPQERLDRSCPQILGRLLDGAVHPGEPSPDHDGDERDRERHVRDDYGSDTKLEAGSDKEHEQAYPDDYLRHHGRGVDRRVGEGLAPEAVACQGERRERAYDGCDGGGRHPDYYRGAEGVEDRLIPKKLSVPLG